jgi:putative tryptophan/tyrosine transport system substrate-binding protein
VSIPYSLSSLRYRAARAVTRRDFTALIWGTAAALPCGAFAQRSAMPVIGFLHSGPRDSYVDMVTEFRRGLGEIGYVEGRNVVIEFRWANNQIDQLPALATDLVDRRVSVIFASGGPLPAHAAKAATGKSPTEIPIVFAIGDDPIWHGLVASWNHPGGNITGVTTLSGELTSKRFELLSEFVPQATVVGYFFDPRARTAELLANQIREVAGGFSRQVFTLKVSSGSDIEGAFAQLAQQMVDALFVGPYPIFSANRDKILRLAARYKIPTMYPDRAYVLNGGLMSYGGSIAETYHSGGVYVGKVLAGATPADLPIQQLTRYELVINLTTAKALGLAVPRKLLLGADEVVD